MRPQILALLIQEASHLTTTYLRFRPVRVETINPLDVMESKSAELADRELQVLQASGPENYETPQIPSAITIKELPEDLSEEATAVPTGCVPCMPPDSQIWSNPEVKSIEEIKAGLLIVDADGKLATVTSTMQRRYKGELIKITVPGQNTSILLTPEHPVLAIRATKCSKNHGKTLCYPKENSKCSGCPHKYEPEWVLAGSLSKGEKGLFSTHMLLMPRIKDIVDIISVNVRDIAGISPRFTRNKIKDNILIDEDFMELLGYYLAEGSVNIPERGAQVRVDFGPREDVLIARTIFLFYKVFGLQAETSPKMPGRVYISSVILGHFLKNLVGSGARQKHIPMWIIKLPEAKLLRLLYGFWLGDGCFYTSYNREVMSASTTSPQLAYALRLILNRLGILHHLGKGKTRPSTIDGRKIKSGKDQWALQLNSNATIRLKTAWGLPSKYRFVQSSQMGIDDKWIYLPIKKITRVPYEGMVMNLETTSENYCVNGIIVHNCALGHYGACTGILNEAVRFAHDDEGMASNEVLDRVGMCMDELNAMERQDLRPQMLMGLPEWEKKLAQTALTRSRAIRHGLEAMTDASSLEEIAGTVQQTRQELYRTWAKQRLKNMSPEEKTEMTSRILTRLEGEDDGL